MVLLRDLKPHFAIRGAEREMGEPPVQQPPFNILAEAQLSTCLFLHLWTLRYPVLKAKKKHTVVHLKAVEWRVGIRSCYSVITLCKLSWESLLIEGQDKNR